jgi:ribosomal 30S subunit maturation factor RimM
VTGRRHLPFVLPASNQEEAFMSAPRFVHDDIVTLTETGQIGTVKEVHQTGNAYVYGIQLKTAASETVNVPEAELELVKIANEDETGLHIRYIT